jgi:hypothetical protein
METAGLDDAQPVGRRQQKCYDRPIQIFLEERLDVELEPLVLDKILRLLQKLRL